MRKAGNNYQNLQGPITIGAPTGGYETPGSINAQALFINGVAVTAGTGAGGVVSVTGTANQVTASPTTGAVVVGLPANVVIPNAVSGVALTISSSTTQALQVGATLGTAPASLDAGQGIALNNASTAGGDQRLLTFGQIGANAYIRPVLGGAGPANAGLQIATSVGGTTFGAAGNVTIAAPSSGNALVVTGASAADAVSFTSVGSSNVLDLTSTTTTNRAALQIGQAGGGTVVIALDGTQQVLPGTTNGDFCVRNGQTIRFSANGYVASQLTISTAGNVTIAAPSSAPALTVNGAAGGAVMQVTGTGVSPTGVSITGSATNQLNAISIQQTGQAQWLFYTPASSNDLRLFTGSDRVVFTSTGNVTINTPTSGIGLVVNGFANSFAAQVNGSSTSGQSNGLFVVAGTTSADTAVKVANQANTFALFQIAGDGNGFFANSTSHILTWAAAGNVTIATPTSGQALTVNGTASSFALQVLAPNTAGVSDGLWIKAGTNGSDNALLVQTAGGSTTVQIYGDGGILVGAATGGDQGLGTVNATGLFVNGVAVGAGSTTLKAVALTTQSVTSSTTYVADTSLTLALTTGKYYQIYAQVPFKNASGVTGGGANFAFTYSGTGGILWGDDLSSSSTIGQPQVQGVSPTTFNSFQNIAPNAFDTGGNMWVFFGTMFAGSVGGNLLVNWAQNTSSATATIRQVGAIMTAIQLN